MKKILNFIISLIFPRTCSVCGKNMGFKAENNICENCLNSLPKLEGLLCKKCSLPLPDGGATCSDCKNTKNIYFDVLKAPYVYSGKMRMLIKKLKYSQKAFLAKDLSAQTAEFIIKENIDKEIDLIVPVPVHWGKRILRGYNQAELLAGGISKIINKPMYAKTLIRKRYTRPQSKLNKNQRHQNLEDMFSINKKYIDKIKNKNILLVDDIATTCSTINQCSKILKENNVKKVIAVSLARAKY